MGEDSQKYSFSGIYKSVAGVHPKISEVMNAISLVKKSIVSKRSEAYKAHTSIDRPKMSIIIQTLLKAQASGVCFTKKNIDDLGIIEGILGLGGLLVGGEIIPDRWLFSRTKKRVISTEIGDKEIKDVLEKGGVKRVTTNNLEKGKPCASEEIIGQLILLAIKAEDIFGCPQDIEWAFADENLWILQARRIPGLKN